MKNSFARVATALLLLLALQLVAVAARFHLGALSGAFEGLELRLLDARFGIRGAKSPAEMARISQSVVVVAMDDATDGRFGHPLPRDVHARMVRRLQSAGARAVLFDVLFLDPSRRDASGDADFARAVRESGHVFLPFDTASTDPADAATLRALQARAAVGTPSAARMEPFRPPFPALFDAARGLGHVDTQSDLDGKFRRSVLLLEKDGVAYPHLALAALADEWGVPRAQIALRGDVLHVGTHVFGPLPHLDSRGDGHTTRKWLLPLDFAGGRTVMDTLTLSYGEVLDGKHDDHLKGRIVLIGETATGTPDLRPAPFDERANFVGIHTNATLLANLLQDDYLRPAPPLLNAALAVLCGVCGGLMALALRPVWSLAGVLLLALLAFVFSCLAFISGGLVVETTAPLLCLGTSAIGMAAFRSATFERASKESARALLETQTLLGHIVNPRLARELAADPQKRLELQIGARREVSVLFCDIRNFTPWCETQTPEGVKSRLDDYFPLLCEICEDDYDGFIDKFIGDAVMVVWNAHRDHPDHAARACAAALAMRRGLVSLNDGWKKQGLAPFDIGIGIASGEAIWGTFGAPNRKVAPTVLGDTVNVAARLEGLSKQFGPIVVSAATKDALGENFRVRLAGEVEIKGKSERQAVYVVEAGDASPAPFGH